MLATIHFSHSSISVETAGFLLIPEKVNYATFPEKGNYTNFKSIIHMTTYRYFTNVWVSFIFGVFGTGG